MISTVSTVKDNLSNATNFVRRNLAAGADHMFIFLEGGDREVLRFLDAHRHVTVIDTDNGYWHHGRPTNLNARQTMNANLVNCLLSTVDEATWLFHIDGDECLDIDKGQLLELGPEVEYVRLATKESVSTSTPAPDDSEYFKRLLNDDELALLTVLGVIARPRNRTYFNGHVLGKVGIRPSWEYGVHNHEAKRLKGPTPDNFTADWLNVLHYESFTPEEFVRKWMAHIESGKETSFREDKEILRSAVTGVLNNTSLSPEQKEQYLLRIYKRRLEDDASTLLELGLISEAAKTRHQYTPRTFSRKSRTTIGKILPDLLAVEKGYFKPRFTNRDPAELMERVRQRAAPTNPLNVFTGSPR